MKLGTRNAQKGNAMKIKVEFSREVPNDIIEKLMENPECSMDDLGMDRYDDYLMAMSIAAYKKENKDASMSELRKWAADDIADGIDSYFFEDMADNYTEYYRDRIKGDIRVYCTEDLCA